MFRTRPTILTIVLALCGMSAANAAVVIGGTRVVFPAQARDVSLRLENKGGDPALVQVWVDDGDERSTPTNAQAPFAITPPVFRIDPGNGHALRIVHVGDDMPPDKEVLYWLNVLEIPPKASDVEGKNVLQLAFRHRLKLFHRPKGLPSSPDRAPATLQWSIEHGADGSSLKVVNPSPYHVSFNAVDLHVGKESDSTVPLGGGMVAPGASLGFPLAKDKAGFDTAKVAFVTINDFGATVSGSAVVVR
ncbi:chaperone protein EcpD [Luteibacter jiangsuensis]|uniref:Chaperone protein EcpD n=1 Tax=Luteibacter jiangsuensis TaxID=637577 RepID=A0ABT9T0E8_9GAMM|nr:fimbria/pilus periplasmic chaperone [Luteibacter jiangsuensis]MDQ0010743.1 chaperone protein EcpD [Luteibacter jiangsuensis]